MDLDLTSPDQLIPLLQQHNLYTQKNLGQHFLIDRSVLDSTIDAASIQPTDTILEIGAGTGVLTRELAKRATRVITFEIDLHLRSLLAHTIGEFTNIELQFKDFLQANITEVFKEPQPAYKLVANLPYNVGSHILDIVLKSPSQPQSITVLLQKEVAQKIVATPPHATYLSNFVAMYGPATLVRSVRPKCFFPPPQVESALLHIHKNLSAQSSDVDLISFSRFLHRGFATPRKMINKPFTNQHLAAASINPQQRPENVTLTDWINLYQVIQSELPTTKEAS